MYRHWMNPYIQHLVLRLVLCGLTMGITSTTLASSLRWADVDTPPAITRLDTLNEPDITRQLMRGRVIDDNVESVACNGQMAALTGSAFLCPERRCPNDSSLLTVVAKDDAGNTTRIERTAHALCVAPASIDAGDDSTTIQFLDVTTTARLWLLQRDPLFVPEGFHDTNTTELTGGAAVGDLDGDGWEDLYVTRFGASDLLFRNRGDGSFEDITEHAGLSDFVLQSNGVAMGDIDNDGDLDIFVTTAGHEEEGAINTRYYLFINDGNGIFHEDAINRGTALNIGRTHEGYSAAFGDYDLDGWIDLFVTGPIQRIENREFLSHNRLMRNLGPDRPGHFQDLTEEAGVSLAPLCGSQPSCGGIGFAATFTDLDQDGFPELAFVADARSSRLFWNNGDGTFTDGTRGARVGTDRSGMGSTFGDFDRDGDLDWFITAIFHPRDPRTSGNRLYRNNGDRLFTDVTSEIGVRDGAWGWGTVWFDADNDGNLDIVMTNGVRFREPGKEEWHHDRMRFWRNAGDGTMIEEAIDVGLSDTQAGKGLLTFDYDHDGDRDVFLVNNAGPPRLYQNVSVNDNDWLRVATQGTVSNRQGLGARVTVQTTADASPQLREIGTASHFLGQSETVAHFGLGNGVDPVFQVIVEWPRSGIRQVFTEVPRNTLLEVTEP